MNRPARLTLWILGAAILLALIILAVLTVHPGSGSGTGTGY
jgi:hypothetical protein